MDGFNFFSNFSEFSLFFPYVANESHSDATMPIGLKVLLTEAHFVMLSMTWYFIVRLSTRCVIIHVHVGSYLSLTLRSDRTYPLSPFIRICSCIDDWRLLVTETTVGYKRPFLQRSVQTVRDTRIIQLLMHISYPYFNHYGNLVQQWSTTQHEIRADFTYRERKWVMAYMTYMWMCMYIVMT